MKIYHSPLFYAHLFFLIFFIKQLSLFIKEATNRNDGSLILALILFVAGSFGIFSGLLIDYGIRIISLSTLVKWVIQLGLSLLLAMGWYRGFLLIAN